MEKVKYKKISILNSKVLFFIVAILAFLFVLSISSKTVNADNEYEMPLDFISNQSSRSGTGWSWDADTATLTLDDLVLDLSGYKQPYKAAIQLPQMDGGVTIKLENTNYINAQGTGVDGQNVMAIYCQGDMIIDGRDEGILVINGMSAGPSGTVIPQKSGTGIKAEGSISLEYLYNPNVNPMTHMQEKAFQAETMDYVISAGKKLNIVGCEMIAGIGVLPDSMGNELSVFHANEGVYIAEKSSIRINSAGAWASGISTDSGPIEMINSEYKFYTGTSSSDQSAILNKQGPVTISDSDILDHNNGTSSINSSDAVVVTESGNITISASNVTGFVPGYGIKTTDGKVLFENCQTDITSQKSTLYVGTGGFTVKGADAFVNLVTDGAGQSAAVCSGPIEITDESQAYFSGKGNGSYGLVFIPNAGDKLNISGEVTTADFSGKACAIKIETDNTEDEPVLISDVLSVINGGTLQYIDIDTQRTFSYSEEILAEDLSNASTRVSFGNEEGVLIDQQPEDAIVSYPDGAEFSVVVNKPDDVVSYQWYMQDKVGKNFTLDGISAKTDTLIIPSTKQKNDVFKFWCVFYDKDGYKHTTKRAYLDLNNRSTFKTVLYIGNYGINPGESLDLSETELGSGIVSFANDGTTVTLDNVNYDNSVNMMDSTITSIGLCMERNCNVDKDYTVILKGENKFTNVFYQESTNGCGIPFDFQCTIPQQSSEFSEDVSSEPIDMWIGIPITRTQSRAPQIEEAAKADLSEFTSVGAQFVVPTVTIKESDEGGSLSLSGGTNVIRILGDLVLDADVTIERSNVHFSDGIVADTLDVMPNTNLDLAVNGSGVSVTGGFRLQEDCKLNIDTVMPRVSQGETLKQAIFVGGGNMVVNSGCEINLNVHATPDDGADIEGFAGINLAGDTTSLAVVGSKIQVQMDAKPGTTPESQDYAKNFIGIMGYMIDAKDTDISVQSDAETVINSAGIETNNNATFDNCNINVEVKASDNIFGFASNGIVELKNTNVDIVTEKYGDDGFSYAFCSNVLKLPAIADGYHVSANATNEDGIAILVDTGRAGDAERGYDKNYKPYRIVPYNKEDCIIPVDNQASIASIPGALHSYVYIESYYDLKDTSKPANNVLLKKSAADIEVKVVGKTKTVTYNGSEQSVSGYDLSSDSDDFDPDKVTFDGKDVAKGKDVGTYPMNLKESQFGYDDPNVKVTFVVVDGWLKIEPESGPTMTVSGSKTWVDDNNAAGKRPDSITIRLYADGTEVDSRTVTEADGWKWEFNDLPKNSDKGEIVYTINEDAVLEYETEIKGYDVTNTYSPGTYYITYNLNGGVYNGSSDTIIEKYKVGTVITIHEAPVKKGYDFLCWEGSKYQPGDKYTVKENHTFVAKWGKKSTPSTGDNSNPIMYICLMLISMVGLFIVGCIRKRTK